MNSKVCSSRPSSPPNGKRLVIPTFGHIDVDDFQDRVFGKGKYSTSKMAKKLTRNGISHIAGFPPAVQCSKLIIKCARQYNPELRQIVAPDGKKLVYLIEILVAEVFNIPAYDTMVYKSKDDALGLYESKPEMHDDILSKDSIKEPRSSHKRLPKKTLLKSDFKDGFAELVMMLNRVMGSPQAASYEPWMWYYIEEFAKGANIINWARLASDNLHEQLTNVEQTKTFYMSSYVVYILARYGKYKGLNCRAPVGPAEGQMLAYDAYPKLHLSNSVAHYRRVNDAFTMHIVRTLQGSTHIRLSKEAMKLIKKYGFWYTQFPKFTYLRIQGCSSYAYRLPRYPTDRMVLLEVSRQSLEYDAIEKRRKKAKTTFPIMIGNSFETCSTISATQGLEEELQYYNLKTHTSRSNFGPYHKIENVNKERFHHFMHVEIIGPIQFMTMR